MTKPIQVACRVPKDGTYYVSVLFEKAAIRALVEQIRDLPEDPAPLVRQLGRMLLQEYNDLNRMDREVGRPRRAGRREYGGST